MNEKPILFSAPMVKAILSGAKTVTRRVVKPQPSTHRGENGVQFECPTTSGSLGHDRFVSEHCRFRVGDTLWVRETFRTLCLHKKKATPEWAVQYLAGGTVFANDHKTKHTIIVNHKATGREMDADYDEDRDRPWKPSIFMPRWASRITLEIVSVRCERLQEITEVEAEAEGFVKFPSSEGGFASWCRDDFAELWDELNGKKFPWAADPYVWRVEFKRIKP